MKIIRCSLLLLILLMLLTGCTESTDEEPISKTGFLLDTVITISIYDSSDEQLLEDAFDKCLEYEQLFSKTTEGSDIDRINSSGGVPVVVSDETLALLKKGLEYCELSDGCFDLTIGQLTGIWNFTSEQPALPQQEILAEAVTHVDYQQIKIRGNTVQLKDPDASLDLGGIAKGYIADQLKLFLLDNGVNSALIDLGGDILVIGSKPDNTDFTIGVQKPFSKRNETITSVKVSDRSVVSSGVYERCFELDEQLYHHILDPATGYPAETDLLEVTIVSDHSADGDALSTICLMLGLEAGMELIEQTKDVEAIFITDEYEVFYVE